MKKILGAIALIALGSSAEAATIEATCFPEPATYTGQSGGGIEVCSFAAVPVGETITGITAEYVFDFTFDEFDPGARSVDFSFDAPGTTADYGGTSTDGTRPENSGVINIAAGEWALFTGANFNVIDAYTGASTAIEAATFNKRFQLTTTTPVPEPLTLGLMGLGLAAAARGLRRRQRA